MFSDDGAADFGLKSEMPLPWPVKAVRRLATGVDEFHKCRRARFHRGPAPRLRPAVSAGDWRRKRNDARAVVLAGFQLLHGPATLASSGSFQLPPGKRAGRRFRARIRRSWWRFKALPPVPPDMLVADGLRIRSQSARAG